MLHPEPNPHPALTAATPSSPHDTTDLPAEFNQDDDEPDPDEIAADYADWRRDQDMDDLFAGPQWILP